jgi:hypothetical protein
MLEPVAGGNVNAADAHQPVQDLLSGRFPLPAACHHAGHLQKPLLAVAQEHGVQGLRQRLGIGGPGAAGHDEGVVLPALFRPKRDAAHPQHGEDVYVSQLVLEGEAHQVEFHQGCTRLQ